jgi:endonuclease/exonuclease/phosphatase family metal-dependent hydrolase
MKNKTKTQKNKLAKYIQKGGVNLPVQALTYNLSWASQENKLLGSEEDFVRRCNYLKRNCYKEALNKIEELHNEINFDVIGIQEVADPELVTEIRKRTGLQGWYRGATWNNEARAYSGCAIFWNTGLLGTMASSKTINLAQPDDDGKCDARTCCIINTTNDINLIVAHFPWLNNKDDVSNISKIISMHISSNGPIIILADTNDSKTLISKENPLIIKNKALSHGLMEQEAKTILKSCCWHESIHEKYKHLADTGDYILSENVENIRIPIIRPTNYKTDKRLYSDHMPVIATVILNVDKLRTQRSRQSSQKKSYKKIYASKFKTMYDKFNTLKSRRWVTIEE